MENLDNQQLPDQNIPPNSEESIHDVLKEMEAVLEKTQSNSDKRGYFAAIYQAETVHVRDGIDQGRFERPDLIESLAVKFARRYLDAYYAYDERMPMTKSWYVAFDATKRPQPCVLQHILMGINAHINLDLGLSVAESVPKGELSQIEGDFSMVNDLIAEMTDVVQDRISEVTPYMKWLDKFGGRLDEFFFRKAVDYSRVRAWKIAEKAHNTDALEYQLMVNDIDGKVSTMGNRLLKPSGATRTLLNVARMGERKSVPQIIDSLVTKMSV